MRKLNAVIQEVTDSLPKEQLIYADDRNFLGVDANDQRIVFIPPDQVVVARDFLSDKQSGSKMHCYVYGPLIHYRLESIGYENSSFTLTHTFMRVDKQMCAISNIDNETFLFEKKFHDKNPMNPYEIERRAISRDEWNRAGLLIDFYRGDQRVLAGNKLRHKQKYYRVFEIIDRDADGVCHKRTVKMTHTFYSINSRLYALSGNGHHISGAFGKVKIAREYEMQSDDVSESKAELVVLKIPKKCNIDSGEVYTNIRSEYALYQEVGLSSGTAVKQKSTVSNKAQEICVMRFFHTDLFNSISQGHLNKLVSHINSTYLIESRELLLINLMRAVTDIFLKLLNQLDVNLNQHRFLHRDIKPENIVLTTKPQLNLLGEVVSIECVEALFIDFGTAKKIQNSDELCVYDEHPVGTVVYHAPEIRCNHFPVRRPLCYTDKTEIYALGKTLKFVLDKLFLHVSNYFNNVGHIYSRDLYQQLIHLSNMMCYEAPVNRINLEYARISMLNLLRKSCCIDPNMNEIQKKELFDTLMVSEKSPFQHVETITCLAMITRLTGVVIMSSKNIQNAVEFKTNLSSDLFGLFCRLDLLLTDPRYRETVLKLLENVRRLLSQWNVETSPSPIELLKREMLQPDYAILRNPVHSSGSSFVGNVVSGASTLISSTVTAVLSVGGFFSSEQSPLRRERSINNNHEEKDLSFS